MSFAEDDEFGDFDSFSEVEVVAGGAGEVPEADPSGAWEDGGEDLFGDGFDDSAAIEAVAEQSPAAGGSATAGTLEGDDDFGDFGDFGAPSAVQQAAVEAPAVTATIDSVEEAELPVVEKEAIDSVEEDELPVVEKEEEQEVKSAEVVQDEVEVEEEAGDGFGDFGASSAVQEAAEEVSAVTVTSAASESRKKGLKHGKGKMTKASGVVKKEGNWLNDMFIG